MPNSSRDSRHHLQPHPKGTPWTLPPFGSQKPERGSTTGQAGIFQAAELEETCHEQQSRSKGLARALHHR